MRTPPSNNHGAKGAKRAGDKQYGRASLSNGWFYAKSIPAHTKRGRRLRSLIDDYLDAAGGTASALQMDFFGSAAMVQWEIDQLEAASTLDVKEHRLLTGQRERLLRQANVLASPSHHDVPHLPEATEAPTPDKATELANLFAAAEAADARHMASLLTATNGAPAND
jgi:hypothetical protein